MNLRARRVANLAAVIGTAAVVAAGIGSLPRFATDPPYEPHEALELFEIADGYRVELFAAEPLVSDPVAMEVDEYGRVYVVEDHGYPDDGTDGGVVRQIRDSSGDGLPDTSIIFASGISKARGAVAWRGGLIVAASPDVLFLRDLDGDGVADEREVIATGFATSNPQLGVNTPIYGLDNWIYMAHVHSGSRVVIGGDSVDVSGRNVRFRPDSFRMEALSGRSQFGHTFDHFGRHLLTVNNNHIYQEIIPARYLERNPDLLLPSVHESISDHGEAAEVFPITDDPDYELFTDVGAITSASGLTSYLGGAFSPPYERATFVAEPVHNLVHADRLVSDGVSLIAERIEAESEFLASRDRWFRPVNFYVGPDGALYVLDYYREIIEQPRFIAQERIDAGLIYNGSDRGRIYRIVPEEGLDMEWLDQLNIDQADPSELVAWLDHENVWWRRTAQRLLVAGEMVEAADALERLVTGGRTPEGRLHALYTLDGLGLLEARHVRRALNDLEPGIREHAVALAEPRLESVSVGLVAALHDDPVLRVRFQVLLTLGEVESRVAASIRRRMLMRDIENDWMQIAALTARGLDPWAEALSFGYPAAAADTVSAQAYVRRLAEMIAIRAEHVYEAAREAANSSRPAWWRTALLEGIASRFDSTRTGADLDRESLLSLARSVDSREVADAALALLTRAGFPETPETDELLRAQAQIIRDAGAGESERVRAIEVIGAIGPDPLPFTLGDVMRPDVPATVQAEAISLLARADADISEQVLERWNEMTPLVRAAASEAMADDSERIRDLLDAVEAGRLNPGSIVWPARSRMMLHADSTLRHRARRLLPDQRAATVEVLEEYGRALEIGGDPSRGAEVFDRVCAVCHQIRGSGGTRFGPDLGTVRSRNPEFLLVDIVHPNREIVSGFEQWTIQMGTGERVSGVIGEETPTAVTVWMPGGGERTIARMEIEAMQAESYSAMPEGLEEQISVQEMADLIAFLRGAGRSD